MRKLALCLLIGVSSANAATLDIAVSQGSHEPVTYQYQLSDQRQTLDLRDANRYTVAVQDKARKKDICREAEYRTGMVMTLRQVEKPADGQYKVEVVGQVSTLKALEEKGRLDCGVNVLPVIDNAAFSDTSIIEVGKPKVMVVDGKTTVLMTVKE
ncbi:MULTISPECIES: hypothetical protein [Pseudomonas]|uniref:hypothetical protein n=1 Tax=Pseudomonas TaxID=286 RepID=UPI00070DCF73|nr:MULTISPECIES: hypothetical protein [Pseudomonas]KQW19981.1 hypothetical protein ASC85_09085 [Pseudomonas sp. Root401]PWD02120.1 hypothetical protein CX658_19415 [Pseudomonas amygdali pv. lachrymans]WHS57579.1 hypothetical protein QLH64_29960 [Pseudomonas brassicacearum]WNZ87341.1 hypothetical protein QOM10_30795 [Pseudomonas sp. P108]